MGIPTMRLTLRTPDGERIQRETDADCIADAMAAYPGHSLICIFNLRPEAGLVSFADGSRYVATRDLAANSKDYLLRPERVGMGPITEPLAGPGSESMLDRCLRDSQ